MGIIFPRVDQHVVRGPDTRLSVQENATEFWLGLLFTSPAFRDGKTVLTRFILVLAEKPALEL